MLNQILPQRIDNTYRGHPLALWLFIPVVVLKTGIALGTIFNGRSAADSADGIPIESFGASGAEAVAALFAMWGLSQLVPGEALRPQSRVTAVPWPGGRHCRGLWPPGAGDTTAFVLPLSNGG